MVFSNELNINTNVAQRFQVVQGMQINHLNLTEFSCKMVLGTNSC